ncbi:MAG: hypothetical protein IJS45_09795 [Clostridia bacterium]|nr:hypothetical protein [Clostridia bacterium]
MRKIIFKVVLSVVIISIILLLSIIIFKVVWQNNARKYDPFRSFGTTWICEEPLIEFNVPAVGEPTAKTEIEGKTISFFIGTRNHYIQADRTGTNELLFSGSIFYFKDKFIIYIDKSSDVLFNGEYSKLVFKRVIENDETEDDSLSP